MAHFISLVYVTLRCFCFLRKEVDIAMAMAILYQVSIYANSLHRTSWTGLFLYLCFYMIQISGYSLRDVQFLVQYYKAEQLV